MNRNRQKAIKAATANHRESMRKKLEHRLEAARARGDEQLIRQLEAEANDLRLK